MIYDCSTQNRRFVIEWGHPETWGAEHETKWVASSHSMALPRGTT